ncbi:hypothetical protein E3N88_26179 [Mikania micrantha]|uniref:Protein FAR1-RELATED SEQUENCE n=1 Tax=Mikania micrantha TaxID=192012 RepID=A0A5N6N8H8_9ASTR|nr:hypothetical protein E3N88_26179 [Mikania micrantha]
MEAGEKGKAHEEPIMVTMKAGDKGKAIVDFDENQNASMEVGEYGLRFRGVDENDMFAIRNRWVPAYFMEIQMCCLMKTTSRYKKVEKIPDEFIIRRWTKNLLPSNLFSSDKLLAGDNSEMSLKGNELMDLVTQCMDLLIGDVEEFDSFFEQIKDMKQNLFEKLKIEAGTRSRLSEIRNLVGDFDDSEVLFSAPEGIRNKGLVVKSVVLLDHMRQQLLKARKLSGSVVPVRSLFSMTLVIVL